MNSQSDTIDEEELRERLIDKLDDQRFGDNVVNKKLLYKDIEWIVDELLDEFKSLLLRERLDERDYFKQVIDDVMSGNISPHFATALADDKIAEAQQELSRLSGEESHE